MDEPETDPRHLLLCVIVAVPAACFEILQAVAFTQMRAAFAVTAAATAIVGCECWRRYRKATAAGGDE